MACFIMGCPRFVRCCKSFVCCLRRLSFRWRSFSLDSRLRISSSIRCLPILALSLDFLKGSIFFGFCFCFNFPTSSISSCDSLTSLSLSPSLSPSLLLLLSSITFSFSTLLRSRFTWILSASSSVQEPSESTFFSFQPTSLSVVSSPSLCRLRLAPVPARIPSRFMSLRYLRRAMDVSRFLRFFRFLNSSRARTCPFFCEKSASPTAFAERRLSALCCCRRLKPELFCRLLSLLLMMVTEC
mmetsp:Transcript_25341/g.59316  ORF Transcript_25341/g.59316 Transcript_25341/m.59316 type:complete len:241 (+) Transcript_25341:484-1206(+)